MKRLGGAPLANLVCLHGGEGGGLCGPNTEPVKQGVDTNVFSDLSMIGLISYSYL